MKIRTKEVTVRELFNGYEDRGERGVVGYGGKLDIRPAYQREFVYNEKQRDAVIHTLRKGYPLNVMYWVKTGEDSYEVFDGQQRTLSICQFLNKEYSVLNDNGNPQYIHNIELSDPVEYEKIMNYKLMVYECEGTHEEKIEWFKIINIAGEVLTNQEILNAVYAGLWLTDAKAYFSKRGCPAYELGKNYVKGNVIRQEFLETALEWIAERDGITVEEYMARHQNDKDASDLWMYFHDIISWVQSRFPKYRNEMKGVNWGYLYKHYKDINMNPNDTEKRVVELMMDDDVTKKSGIYPYILTNSEKYLSIRNFTPGQKRAAYERQNGICPYCSAENNNKKYEIWEMEADHITPWSQGGKTVPENCQMLCKSHNRKKSDK